jgi:hypothetical protein
MLSSIIELPQKVREAKQNVIIHSIIIGNVIDFNKWFLKCEQAFDNRMGDHDLFLGYSQVKDRDRDHLTIGQDCFVLFLICQLALKL